MRNKQMRTLRVADLEAKPGEKVSGYVHVIGAEFGIPVTLICGEKEGGTVLISGGVHNAEYVGIQAAMQLADELDPKKIAGNIIVIRLMNRTGFEHRTMSLTYEDGKNLNRVFPGNPNGTLSDRIAYTVVTEFFQKADYYVDLHCGDGFEGLVSYVYCTGAAASEVAAKSREMAEIAHVDYLVTSMCGTGGAYNYAGSIDQNVGTVGDLSGFSDQEQVSGWARTQMAWAVGCGLINGKSGGALDPAGRATRSEVAAILERFVGCVLTGYTDSDGGRS